MERQPKNQMEAMELNLQFFFEYTQGRFLWGKPKDGKFPRIPFWSMIKGNDKQFFKKMSDPPSKELMIDL